MQNGFLAVGLTAVIGLLASIATATPALACTTAPDCPVICGPKSYNMKLVNSDRRGCFPVGYNGTHRQVASNNLEYCPDCRVIVQNDPRYLTFRLASNNRWSAEMRYSNSRFQTSESHTLWEQKRGVAHGGGYYAVGDGCWPSDWPKPFRGRCFKIFLSGKYGVYRGTRPWEMRIETPGLEDIVSTFEQYGGKLKY